MRTNVERAMCEWTTDFLRTRNTRIQLNVMARLFQVDFTLNSSLSTLNSFELNRLQKGGERLPFEM